MKRFLLFFCFFLPASVAAASSEAQPLLRIETGAHVAVFRTAISRQHRYVATASEDKTVRIWEQETGNLVRTIRPPIGENNEGKLYAIDISPDGKTVVCGGWTGLKWENNASLYVFDRESGAMIKRIRGLPDVPTKLSYSKDGAYIAAGLGRQGLRVYKTSDYSLAAKDDQYKHSIYGIDFADDNRIVTSSFDGHIRMYDGGFKLVAKQASRAGREPFEIRFSPDGTKIAAGFFDSPRIEVFQAKDLSSLYQSSPAAGEGSTAIVEWSGDGKMIYAGGTFSMKGKHPVIRTSDASQGAEWKTMLELEAVVSHISVLAKGELLVSTEFPSFGIYDPAGRNKYLKANEHAGFKNSEQMVMASSNGMEIQFKYSSGDRQFIYFSFDDRVAAARTGIKPGVSAPRTDGLTLTGWKNGYKPALAGRPLHLLEHELSKCVAVSKKADYFAVGTEWHLRFYKADGAEQWKTAVPAPVGSVNITGSGKVIIAALGDGTVRWYRVNDGQEVLAFYLHSDRKRWLAWTPSGYYDAAPGAEELVGWHIHNGLERDADFFPVSRFRSVYYRPDMIAKMFAVLDEAEALRQSRPDAAGAARGGGSIQQLLPPVVTILHPVDQAEVQNPSISIRAGLRTPSGEPVTSVRILVDGRPVEILDANKLKERKVESRDPAQENVFELSITVPEKDSEISLIAENRHASGEPSSVRLKWIGPASTDQFVIRPKLYVLAIGVSKYKDKGLQLQYAAKDAQDFARVMQKQSGKLYESVQVKVFSDNTAAKDDILDGLDWLQRSTTAKDVAMLFIAGHGVNDQNGVYYFLPVNADIEKLKRTGVIFSEIKNVVAALAGKTVVFIDTCHSGNVMGTRRGMFDINAVVNELISAENGAIVFASSTGRQYSVESPKWNNGAFTKALLEGVNGKADYTGKGRVTVNMLDLYISERVKDLTKGLQTPTTTKPVTIADFPIAVIK